MLIRCSRCQALYSLQDGVAAGGTAFRVECGRCALVFDATIPKRTSAVDHDATTPVQSPRVPPRKPEAPGAMERQALKTNELAKALKPRRPGDSEGELEQEMTRGVAGRRIMYWGGGGVLVVALLVLVILQLRHGGLSREATARMEKGHAKLLRDDMQSLEQASTLFTEAARMSPGEAVPEAERAFALLLQAATHKDLADRLEIAARDRNDKVAKLQLEKPDGFEKQIAVLAEQVAQIAQEREPHVRDAQRLLQQGVAAAKAALDDDAEEPAALRAMALYCALADAADRGARYLAQAEAKSPQDAFSAWTKSALAMSGTPTRDKQDRALSALATARQAEPKMVRAQVDVAAIALDRQELGPAREGLTKALAENPQHERAKRLLALVPAAP